MAVTIILPAVIIAVLYGRIVYKIRHSMGAKKLQKQFPTKGTGASSGEAGPEAHTQETDESNDIKEKVR